MLICQFFSSKIRIDYQVPDDGRVAIKVYDVSGREAVVLVDEVKQAGYYTAEFDGSNFASGIYFYRIIADGNGIKFVKTMKMAVVK